MKPEETKSTEFARLFELFERLASQRSRDSAPPSNSSIEDVSSLNAPEDFAPLIKHLNTVLATRAQRCYIRQHKINERPRRNTVATASPSMESAHKADAKAIVATFPLGRLYLFTFKFMIHKLYELEEWAEKVKEIVEKSQSQFKPLGETEYVGRYAEGIKGSHGGKRKPSVPAGVGRRGDVHHTRSHSAGKTKGLGALPLRRRSRNAFLEALD